MGFVTRRRPIEFGEYLYRETAGFVTKRRPIDFVARQQMVAFEESGQDEGRYAIGVRTRVVRVEVRRIEFRIHGEWWVWVLVDFCDLTGIDSSAVGDGKSQEMLECTRMWHAAVVDPFQSARRTESVWPDRTGRASRDCRLDGTKYVPPRGALVGRIRSPFSLGPTRVPWFAKRTEAGTRRITRVSFTAILDGQLNGLTIDKIRSGQLSGSLSSVRTKQRLRSPDGSNTVRSSN